MGLLDTLLSGLAGAGEGAGILKKHDDERKSRALEAMRLAAASRRYDPDRGGIVDETTGTFAPVPGLPPRQRPPERAYDPSRGAVIDLDSGKANVPPGLPPRESAADPYGGRTRAQWLKDQADLENIRNTQSPEGQALGAQRAAENRERNANRYVAAAAARLGTAATPQQLAEAAKANAASMGDKDIQELDIYAAIQRRSDVTARNQSPVDRILAGLGDGGASGQPGGAPAVSEGSAPVAEPVPPGLTLEKLQADYDAVRRDPNLDPDTKYQATMRYIRLKRALTGAPQR
jgi:hypothetical protein